jgi:hypothetical protein
LVPIEIGSCPLVNDTWLAVIVARGTGSNRTSGNTSWCCSISA